MDCPAGQFASVEASSVCGFCAAGRFSSAASATVRENCTVSACQYPRHAPDVGLFLVCVCFDVSGVNVNGAWSCCYKACDPCVAGRASEAGHSACTNCISGSFAFSAGSSRCELCQRGRASAVGAGDATGASICSECEPGYFYDEVRAVCAEGWRCARFV